MWQLYVSTASFCVAYSMPRDLTINPIFSKQGYHLNLLWCTVLRDKLLHLQGCFHGHGPDLSCSLSSQPVMMYCSERQITAPPRLLSWTWTGLIMLTIISTCYDVLFWETNYCTSKAAFIDMDRTYHAHYHLNLLWRTVLRDKLLHL